MTTQPPSWMWDNAAQYHGEDAKPLSIGERQHHLCMMMRPNLQIETNIRAARGMGKALKPMQFDELSVHHEATVHKLESEIRSFAEMIHRYQVLGGTSVSELHHAAAAACPDSEKDR